MDIERLEKSSRGGVLIKVSIKEEYQKLEIEIINNEKLKEKNFYSEKSW